MFRDLTLFNIDYLIKIRLHIGHKDILLNKKINPYLYGIRHNVNIYDINKLWKSFRYLFHNFINLFLQRNVFFIVGTSSTLPMDKLLNNLSQTYPFLINDYIGNEKFSNSFYISGFVDKKWIGGLFSNWKIYFNFIKYLHNYSVEDKIVYKFQKYFYFIRGIINLKRMPIPDFILMLNNDRLAIDEIKKLQIPMIGLIDSDMDPQDFVYKFLSNNDSIETIEFLFEFFGETAKEGRLKEQEKFLLYLCLKIKKKLLLKKKNVKKKKFKV